MKLVFVSRHSSHTIPGIHEINIHKYTNEKLFHKLSTLFLRILLKTLILQGLTAVDNCGQLVDPEWKLCEFMFLYTFSACPDIKKKRKL